MAGVNEKKRVHYVRQNWELDQMFKGRKGAEVESGGRECEMEEGVNLGNRDDAFVRRLLRRKRIAEPSRKVCATFGPIGKFGMIFTTKFTGFSGDKPLRKGEKTVRVSDTFRTLHEADKKGRDKESRKLRRPFPQCWKE